MFVRSVLCNAFAINKQADTISTQLPWPIEVPIIAFWVNRTVMRIICALRSLHSALRQPIAITGVAMCVWMVFIEDV